jgi:phosphoribosylamine--glycine ligase
VEEIRCPGGNPGIARFADVTDKVPRSNSEWLDLAQLTAPDLVVIGPEAPLAAGLTDVLEADGFAVFGPRRAGAQLESSKTYAKECMAKAGVPTAAAQTFSDANAARDFARTLGLPVVVKADGLAAGKGVTVATTWEEADQAINENLVGQRFGASSAQVLIEEFMAGEEASIFGLCDGKDVWPLVAAQDHKRVFDGDAGPNTGGMGAYAPTPIATPELMQQVQETVFRPMMKALLAMGIPYRGVLYAGLMIKDGKARIVEFNCRFGDPETQVVLPLVEGDFAGLLMACATGTLASFLERGTIRMSSNHAATVVLASGGYPGDFTTGHRIEGLGAWEDSPNAIAFHAGTRLGDDGAVLTAGGRVISCTAWDTTLAGAVSLAYRVAESINFPGKHLRRDIAYRALGPRN